jgi:hypothetical protein
MRSYSSNVRPSSGLEPGPIIPGGCDGEEPGHEQPVPNYCCGYGSPLSRGTTAGKPHDGGSRDWRRASPDAGPWWRRGGCLAFGTGRKRIVWCCRTGLNCRPLPYQGSALPLSYGSMRNATGSGPRPRPRAAGSCHKDPARASAAEGCSGERNRQTGVEISEITG